MYTGPIIHLCENLSFFSLIRRYWLAKKDDKIRKNRVKFVIESNLRPFHRLCSMMRKMQAGSLIIEEFNDLKELSYDNEVKDELEGLKIFFIIKNLLST